MIPLLLAALLTLADPVGDTAGNGTLRPPTSEIYAGTASFDLLGVRLLERPNLTLEIAMGALDNPAGLVNGFSHPIIEVYLDSAEGGENELLPGSGMRLADGFGWETALRLTGDTTELHHLSAAGDRVRMPVQVIVEDGNLLVSTALPSPEVDEVVVYAIVGVYDPFSTDGWRAVEPSASPWAFSSSEQLLPVVDVLAPHDEGQIEALQSGVLPIVRSPGDRGGVPWLLMMAFGVLVAVVGIGLRSRVPAGLDDAAVGGRASGPDLGSGPDLDSGPDLGSGSAVESDGTTVSVPAPAVAADVPSAVDAPVKGVSGENVPSAAAVEQRGDDAGTVSPDDEVPVFVIGRKGRTRRPPAPPPAPAAPGSPSPAAESAPASSATGTSGTGGSADARPGGVPTEPEPVHDTNPAVPPDTGGSPATATSAPAPAPVPTVPDSGTESGIVDGGETSAATPIPSEGTADDASDDGFDDVEDEWETDDAFEERDDRRWSTAWTGDRNESDDP